MFDVPSGLADLPPADRARVMGAIVARMHDLDEKCAMPRSVRFAARRAASGAAP